MSTTICQDCTRSTSGDCGKHGVVGEWGAASVDIALAALAEREATIARLNGLLRRAQANGCPPHTKECPWQFSEKREAAALAEDCNCGVGDALADSPPHAALDAALAAARREAAEAIREATWRDAATIALDAGASPELVACLRNAAIRAVPLPDGAKEPTR